MLIRPATSEDAPAIIKILKELDLYYQALIYKDFWVAEAAGEIIGTAQLEPHDDFVYLSSVGIKSNQQKHGAGRSFVEKLLLIIKQPVYLYTIIPDFFQKVGFKIDQNPPANLPSKERYECEECFPDKCVTMVKYLNVA